MDVRLRTVSQMIRSVVHADVGSDHAQLLVSLLRSGRIERGIAIENKLQPFRNSRAALMGLAGEARFGDGLEELEPDEVNSLSICGMGGESIVRILDSHVDRVPRTIVLQPNRRADLVRQWALRRGFRLIEEQIAWGHWPYEIMKLEKANVLEPDPAYSHVELQAAIMFGPLILRQREPRFLERLRMEKAYFSQFKQLKPQGRDRLRLIDVVLGEQHEFRSTQE